jgi:hypothetical protein
VKVSREEEQQVQHVGKVHALYVAAPEQDVVAVVAERFEGFTVFTETGYYKGEPEPMVVVQVATDDGEAVIALGRTLRETFNQEGVGYVVDGVYRRITGTVHAQGSEEANLVT